MKQKYDLPVLSVVHDIAAKVWVWPLVGALIPKKNLYPAYLSELMTTSAHTNVQKHKIQRYLF